MSGAEPTTQRARPSTGSTGGVVAARRGALEVIVPGSTTGIGSLPHRSAGQAADFAIEAYDIPSIPSLPRRSPSESSVAQALVGTPGVTLGQYGTVAVDVSRLDPGAPVHTDLWRDNFVGLRTFLQRASEVGLHGPVKWQFVGPISVGVALRRAGAPAPLAFRVGVETVVSHLRVLAAEVARVLPDCPQLVVLDEPFVEGVMSREFPITPGEAVDLLSEAMASLEPFADVGVHACGDVDIATMLESGPRVLSLPARAAVVPLAGYLDRFLANGGWIAWGAVATEGPIGVTANRSWHQLSTLWTELVDRGVDRERLVRQCILTPECGLGTHSPVVAERVCHTLRDVSRRFRASVGVELRPRLGPR